MPFILIATVILVMSSGLALAEHLAGSEWRPLQIGHVSLPANTRLYVQFKSQGRIAGFSGCNYFFGTYKVTAEKKLTLSVVDVKCDRANTDLEIAFLNMLRSVVSFDRHRVVLRLFNQEDRQIAVLAQTDWD